MLCTTNHSRTAALACTNSTTSTDETTITAKAAPLLAGPPAVAPAAVHAAQNATGNAVASATPTSPRKHSRKLSVIVGWIPTIMKIRICVINNWVSWRGYLSWGIR